MDTNNTYNGYQIEDLKQAFDSVCDPEDWKGPIAVAVKGEAVNLVMRAIQFYTATTPTVNLNMANMLYHITSEGYRMGPAGDH